jgi:hypothetical protein
MRNGGGETDIDDVKRTELLPRANNTASVCGASLTSTSFFALPGTWLVSSSPWPADRCWRPTLLGASRMTWKQLWPIQLILLA